MKNMNNTRGSMLIQALIFASVIVAVASVILQYVSTQHTATRIEKNKEQILDISEAGINYYKWVLAHNPDDYFDGQGNGSTGPYVHDFKDPAGDVIGRYSLEIDPPDVGSSTVTVRSTSYLLSNPERKRTIEAKYGIPTLANFMFLLNSNVDFSATTSVSGRVHSNGGIRFDGACDSIISSYKPDYDYDGTTKDGVWRSTGLQDTCPSSFWEFPVSLINFDDISVDLGAMKTSAQNGGKYLASTGNIGYHINFNANGTYDVYDITRLKQGRDGYVPGKGWVKKRLEIQQQTLIGTYALPSNGIIFVEDDVWVDGELSGRVTIASAKFPEQIANYTDIIVNANTTYVNGPQVDSLGLIAQGNVEFPFHVPDDTAIHAAMIAQKGKVFRAQYPGNTKSTLDVLGAIISNEPSALKYGTYPNYSSGFINTHYDYNSYLLESPPPHFPTLSVSGQYQLISWQEVANP